MKMIGHQEGKNKEERGEAQVICITPWVANGEERERFLNPNVPGLQVASCPVSSFIFPSHQDIETGNRRYTIAA